MHLKLGPFELTFTFGRNAATEPYPRTVVSYDAVTDIPNKDLRHQMESRSHYSDPCHLGLDEFPGQPADAAIKDQLATLDDKTKFWSKPKSSGMKRKNKEGGWKITKDMSRTARKPMGEFTDLTAEQSIDVAQRAADTYSSTPGL